RDSTLQNGVDRLRVDKRSTAHAAKEMVRDLLKHDKKKLVGPLSGTGASAAVGKGVAVALGGTALGTFITRSRLTGGTLAIATTAATALSLGGVIGKKVYDKAQMERHRKRALRHLRNGKTDKRYEDLRYLLSHGELQTLAHRFEKALLARTGYDAEKQ